MWCCIWIHGRQLLARAKTYRRSCRSPWIGPAWRFWAISFVLDMVPWADVSNVDTTNYRQVCFYLQSAPQMEDLNFSGQVQAALLAFLNARHGIKYVVHCFCDMHTDCCYTTYICILDILLIFADPHTDYGIPCYTNNIPNCFVLGPVQASTCGMAPGTAASCKHYVHQGQTPYPEVLDQTILFLHRHNLSNRICVGNDGKTSIFQRSLKRLSLFSRQLLVWVQETKILLFKKASNSDQVFTTVIVPLRFVKGLHLKMPGTPQTSSYSSIFCGKEQTRWIGWFSTNILDINGIQWISYLLFRTLEVMIFECFFLFCHVLNWIFTLNILLLLTRPVHP